MLRLARSCIAYRLTGGQGGAHPRTGDHNPCTWPTEKVATVERMVVATAPRVAMRDVMSGRACSKMHVSMLNEAADPCRCHKKRSASRKRESQGWTASAEAIIQRASSSSYIHSRYRTSARPNKLRTNLRVHVLVAAIALCLSALHCIGRVVQLLLLPAKPIRRSISRARRSKTTRAGL